MFTTPRKGGASTTVHTPRSSTKPTPLRGFFADGIWHCNCSPRLPASYFKVKKDGANKGRGFYTCQKPKEEGCGFFLWEDDAVKREMKTVISNSRTEPNSATKNKATRLGTVDSQSTMNTTNSEQETTDEDEFGEWPLTKEDEQVAVKVAEQAVPSPYPETPRKARKTNAFTTPGTKRKRDEVDSLLTPATMMGRSGGDIFTTPATSRLKGGMFDGNERLGLASPTVTPTPGRFRDAAKEPDLHSGENYEITEEVMNLLKDEQIKEQTGSTVRDLLNRYAMKASGIARGRDITRVSLKTKDAKISELQQRISALETEREMDKAIVKQWKNDIRRYTTKTER